MFREWWPWAWELRVMLLGIARQAGLTGNPDADQLAYFSRGVGSGRVSILIPN